MAGWELEKHKKCYGYEVFDIHTKRVTRSWKGRQMKMILNALKMCRNNYSSMSTYQPLVQTIPRPLEVVILPVSVEIKNKC